VITIKEAARTST